MVSESTRSFDDRRGELRHNIVLDVNYRHGDSYLFSRSSNLSEMGIFLVTPAPPATGTRMDLRFSVPGEERPIEVTGEVMWIEQGQGGSEPGMGIRFIDPTPEIRRRVQALIRTIAYLE